MEQAIQLLQQQVGQLQQQVGQLQQQVGQLQLENRQLREENRQLTECNARLEQVTMAALNAAVEVLVENGRYEEAYYMKLLSLKTQNEFSEILRPSPLPVQCVFQAAKTTLGQLGPVCHDAANRAARDVETRAEYVDTWCDSNSHGSLGPASPRPGALERRQPACARQLTDIPQVVRDALIHFNLQLYLKVAH